MEVLQPKKLVKPVIAVVVSGGLYPVQSFFFFLGTTPPGWLPLVMVFVAGGHL